MLLRGEEYQPITREMNFDRSLRVTVGATPRSYTRGRRGVVGPARARARGRGRTGDQAFDGLVVNGLMRLARLADSLTEILLEAPDAEVRRSAAVLAARAHPILAGLGD